MSIEPNTKTIGSFMDYKKLQMTLANDLEHLKTFSEEIGLTQESIDLIDGALQRLKEETFTVAVVGEFKKGKSSFINALLGQNILPADVLPTTAALNRVTYGIKPMVKIFFKDETKAPQEAPIDQLAEYVTKLSKNSEHTASLIKEAVVYYPLAYCQNNVDIIDTPGLNDETAMNEVTFSVLSQVDAAVMLIASNAPFSQSENDFLQNKLLTSDLGRVIFLVNLWENLNDAEAVRVVQHIKERIQEYVLERAVNLFGEDSEEYQAYRQKIGEPKIFGVYVKPALEARLKNDQSLLKKSRLPQFETALEQFLTLDRGAILLQVPFNRVITSCKEILGKLDLRERALKMQHDQFQSSYEKSVAEIATLRERQSQELKLIDGAAADIKLLVRPIVYEFPNELKQSVREAVANFPIDSNDLDNKKGVSEKLGKAVESTVQRISEKLSKQIEDHIQRGVNREVARLHDFACSVDQTLKSVETNFSIEADDEHPHTAASEVITGALSLFTGFGGIWSGYRVAGVKGAIVGGVSSAVVGTAAVIAIGILGAPLTLPAMLGIIVASAFPGSWVAKKVFRRDRVENYKADFIGKALEQIELGLHSQRVDQKIDDQIDLAFGTLKQTLRTEVDNMLDNTQKTLADLSDKRGRDEAMTESEQQKVERIRQQTLRILGNAQRQSNQLMEIRSV